MVRRPSEAPFRPQQICAAIGRGNHFPWERGIRAFDLITRSFLRESIARKFSHRGNRASRPDISTIQREVQLKQFPHGRKLHESHIAYADKSADIRRPAGRPNDPLLGRQRVPASIPARALSPPSCAVSPRCRGKPLLNIHSRGSQCATNRLSMRITSYSSPRFIVQQAKHNRTSDCSSQPRMPLFVHSSLLRFKISTTFSSPVLRIPSFHSSLCPVLTQRPVRPASER